MGINLDSINKLFRNYQKFVKSKYIVSYPRIELECKIDYRREVKIEKIAERFKKSSIELDEIIRREETHHLYGSDRKNRTFIFSRGSRDVWIKEKCADKIGYTPMLKAPILIRREQKLKPTSLTYKKIFLETLNWAYEGSFRKECVDISFWFRGFLFTLTFANAIKNKAVISQIEIEYDGHSNLIRRPTKSSVMKLFDEVIENIIPRQFRYFTTLSKNQWLRRLNSYDEANLPEDDNSRQIITGLHVLGEINTEYSEALSSITYVQKNISAIIKKFGLSELGSFYYRFPGGGFTGVVSLTESHVAVHTWPELKYLTLDVYLCDYKKNNSQICKEVFKEISALFKPQKINKRLIKR